MQDFIDKYPALTAIGNTPLVELDIPQEIADIGEASIYAKFEHLNPGGSIKDRPVLRMLAEAIIDGTLTPDKIILDATSGNAGIAYAMIGAILGYPVELVMPENASEERKKRLVAHGANLVFTDAQKGYDEALYEVKRRFQKNPDRYFYCDQYSNLNNPLAHYETTAVELLDQAPFITHFVAGVGTGGTISGIGRRLKETNPDIQVICIDFEEWPGVEGLKPLGEGHIIPETFDRSVVDQMLHIDTLRAYEVSSLMAEKGIFAGQSSGAYLLGAIEVASSLKSGNIVTIFNDIGERYFSTSMWD
ncbi:MAG: cysteine synthase [Chloroflexi bacterium]|nr:cysteine synthase [Chloroflexota bacterium]MBE43420.1 cysteine synthase [Chloroflexota bacterium]MQG00931.1 cysteine synthase family protein [SAR202 cluster bacterium]